MEKGELGLIITRGISTALSRYNPGMSIADCVLGQTFIGCAVLLSDFPVSLSTESTGLSSHPVHNFNLKKNPNSLEYALLRSQSTLHLELKDVFRFIVSPSMHSDQRRPPGDHGWEHAERCPHLSV